MERSLLQAYRPNDPAKTAGAMVVLAFLALFTGCQGVSAGGGGGQSSTLSLSAATLNYGSVAASSTKTLSVLATNSGPNSITVSGVAVSSKYFSLTAPSLPVTMASGQSATFNVMFSPNAAGSFSGTATVTSDASNPSVTLGLSGSGIGPGQLSLNPTAEAFGSVTTGSQQSQTVTLTNTGGTSVNISQAAASGSGFQISGITTPLTLNSSQSTTFVVAFAPQTAGSASGAITISSNASNPTLTLPLTGTGVSPGVLTDNPFSLSFGNVTVGSNESLSETVTNTGGSSVTISQAIVSGAGFSLSGISTPLSLPPGQSATFSVTFSPTSAASASGAVTINSTVAPLTIALSGNGTAAGQLTLSPSSENFGSVTTGTQQSQTVTLTNTGGASVNISQATISGTGFQLSGITVPLALSPSQSTTLKLTFSPRSTGTASGTLTIVSDASNPTLTMSLSGTGIAPGGLGSNPSSLNFGSITVGNNSSLSETVTNTGGSSVTISQAAVSGSGFGISGISTPLTLAAGQGATFSVTFTPASTAPASGSVTITSNASNPTLTIPLSGTGVSPGLLSPNPSSLSFGSVTVGNNKTLTETLTNTGGTTVTISQAVVSGGGFSGNGISVLTVAPGQSTSFTVTFAPTSVTSASGNVMITSNASNSTLTIPLAGTGVSPGTLSPNPTSLSFGNVTVGNSSSLSETITNSGGSSVTISQVAVSGTGFTVSGISTPLTLAPGQSVTFSATFGPTSATAASGSVTVSSNASNPTLTIPLSGTGVSAGTLGSNPTSLSFGSVVVGNNSSLSETVTNTGGTSVTISQVAASGTGFSLSGISTPLTLGASQSKTFTVTFTPTSATSASGSVTVTSNASNPTLTISLSGSGTSAVGQLSITPSTLGLGNVVVGTSASAQGNLTATGASVIVAGATTNNSEFSIGGLSLPVTIPAGQSVPFTITFSPLTTGTVTATLTVTSNAQPSTSTETLTGTGTPAPTHSVSLSWTASTSSNISGYNIYRALYSSSCGAFSKINALINTTTLYTDSAVTDGTSYCYAATAVDTSNQESAYSNIVSNVQIPTP